jgi:hypothetical protein
MQISSNHTNISPKSYLFIDKSEQIADLQEALALFDKCLSPLTPHWVSKDTLNHKPKHLRLRKGKNSPREKDHFDFISLQERADYGYLKYASDFWVGTFVIDIDANVASKIEQMIRSNPDLPLPNIVIKNPINGHVQLYFCLRNSVCIDEKNKRYSKKAVVLLNAVKTRLKELLGGDFAHRNSVAKNPYGCMWNVSTMRAAPYDLAEIAKITQVYERPVIRPFLFTKHVTAKAVKLSPNIEVGERNHWLFERVRHYAYKLYFKHGEEWTKRQFTSCLFDFMNKLNVEKCVSPLCEREVKEICRSITRFCYSRYTYSANSSDLLRKIAQTLGKKGGKAKGKAYSKLRQKALRLFRKGLSVADIVNSTNLSKSTVYALIKQYKSRIQKNRKSIAAKPNLSQKSNFPNSYQYGVYNFVVFPHLFRQSCEARLAPMVLKQSFYKFISFITGGR